MARAPRRYLRTIILGVLALAALLWMAVDQFGVSRRELSQLFLGSVLAVGLVILGAAVALLAGVALRSAWRRLRGREEG